jgi:hypothetical protein
MAFRFVKRREWRGAEPQASGEGEGLYSRSLHLGNKFLAMESGAEGAADAQQDSAACREMTQTSPRLLATAINVTVPAQSSTSQAVNLPHKANNHTRAIPPLFLDAAAS